MCEMKFGYIPSPPDYRDYAYGMLVTKVALPEQFDWRNKIRHGVKDQGNYGTCVGHAAATVKEIQEALNSPVLSPKLSPLFIYSLCKELDGIPKQEGTFIRTAMKVLTDYGVCEETYHSYGLLKDVYKPPKPDKHAMENAVIFKNKAYARIQTLSELKQAILKSPVNAGLTLMKSFLDVKSNGFVPAPGDVDQDMFLGNHAMAVVGYDDNMKHGKHKGYFIVQNSHGKTWGDEGFGYIPYDYFTWRDKDMGMTMWQESWSSVDILMPPKQAKKVELWAGSSTALVDGQPVVLDQALYINPETARTLVPLRFVSEILGYRVTWNAFNRKITLEK